MNLSRGEVIDFPESDCLYLEKHGPFMETAPQVWPELHQILSTSQLKKAFMKSMVGLSHVDPHLGDDDEKKYTYQAGVILAPSSIASLVHDTIPSELKSRKIAAGKFLKFLLTGPYSQLGEAYPLAISILHENGYEGRDEEFCMEIYLNTPDDTAEENLQTEIYLPIR
jgi:DNA gyrase inhibitor GyrI